MTISDVLQVQDVAIGEAHGIPGGRKMWWLPVAHGTAYIDVEATEDNQLLLVSISTGPSSAELDGDLAVIRSIVVQIVPQDGWFAGDWFSAPVQDLQLPAVVLHDKFRLELNRVKGKTILTLTPAEQSERS